MTHPFEPVFDAHSEILILGTFPSVKSRLRGFYYGHPHNRFWNVLAAVYSEPVPATVLEKTALLLRHRLALWDVLASCEITGSDDSSIRVAEPNDFSRIVELCRISKVLCNGTKAYDLNSRFHCVDAPSLRLPSTSPANAGYSLERLTNIWRAALCNC